MAKVINGDNQPTNALVSRYTTDSWPLGFEYITQVESYSADEQGESNFGVPRLQSYRTHALKGHCNLPRGGPLFPGGRRADDFLKVSGHREDVRCQVSDAEIMTAALLSAIYFYGNHTTAWAYMHHHQGIHHLDKSQFNRRLSRLQTRLWAIFRAVGQTLKELNTQARYLIDSFPVVVCDNIRIRRCWLLQEEAHRGYSASKRRYFYGFRVQVITTGEGLPVDFHIYAGAFVDVTALQAMSLDLPPGSELYADSGYTDYELEDLMAECDQIGLLAVRKSNAKRGDDPATAFLKKNYRRRIETVFSQIKAHFPAKIHAVTPQGYLLKVTLFVMAFTFDKLTT